MCWSAHFQRSSNGRSTAHTRIAFENGITFFRFGSFIPVSRVSRYWTSFVCNKNIADIKNMKMITLFLYAVCILLCLIGNIATMRQLMKTQARELQEEADDHAHSTRARTQRLFVVTMVIVTSCLVVAIVPFTPLKFLTGVENIRLPAEVKAIVQTFYTINFGINPALYFWRVPRFRKCIIAVLCCIKRNI